MSCQPDRKGKEEQIAATPNQQRPEVRSYPVTEPPMDREALLLLVARAASEYAAGDDDGEAQRTLDGRPFEFRIRFACASENEHNADSFGSRLEDDRLLRLRAAPNLGAEEPLVAEIAGNAFEAVEGFWLRRPWLLHATCPRAAEAAAPVSGKAQPAAEAQPAESAPIGRIGIAQFFSETDPRTLQRRQRAYEATKRLDSDEAPSAQGYDLILSGRLRRLPDNRVIACTGRAPDIPPSCIISAEFDRVRFERPDSKEILAEWGGA